MVQGVASAHQASQLAEAALLELSLAQNPPAAAAVADGVAAHDTAHEYGPALVAGVDGILRCCLRGQRPHAAAVLSIARGLLQQGQQWVQQGYRSLGAGSADRAVAVLLLFNSQVGMLAGAGLLGRGARRGLVSIESMSLAHHRRNDGGLQDSLGLH